MTSWKKHSGQGRTPVSCDQMPARASQDTLQGLGQEQKSIAGDVCAEQFVDGAHANFAGAAGMSAPAARVDAQ